MSDRRFGFVVRQPCIISLNKIGASCGLKSGLDTATKKAKGLASTNLILNLRYPSCGETSGTLFHAIEAGGRVILSDYQSFSEEPAVYHVSIDPDEEKNQIVDALKKEFRLWKIGANQKQDDMKALAKKSASLVCLDVISSLIKRSNNGDSHEIANR